MRRLVLPSQKGPERGNRIFSAAEFLRSTHGRGYSGNEKWPRLASENVKAPGVGH